MSLRNRTAGPLPQCHFNDVGEEMAQQYIEECCSVLISKISHLVRAMRWQSTRWLERGAGAPLGRSLVQQDMAQLSARSGGSSAGSFILVAQTPCINASSMNASQKKDTKLLVGNKSAQRLDATLKSRSKIKTQPLSSHRRIGSAHFLIGAWEADDVTNLPGSCDATANQLVRESRSHRCSFRRLFSSP